MVFPWITCKTSNQKCLIYIIKLTLSSTYQWFEESIGRNVGNGRDTFFGRIRVWEVNLCVGGLGVCLIWWRISRLWWPWCVIWVRGMVGVGWQWRRRLWAWEEEMLEECRILFHDISLHHDFSIHWQWRIDPSGGYSVQGLYQLLTTQELHNHDVPTNLIWHQQVPLNVSIFAWRLIWNSLSSKDNLVECDIISLETQHCVSGVAVSRLLNICFFLAPVLALCGV